MTKNKLKPRPFAQDFSGESKTQQHFKDSCDVNNIVSHYAATGLDPYQDRLQQKRFGYASSLTFEDALRKTTEIESSFSELPSEVRSGFANSPAKWLDSLIEPEPPLDENVENSPSEDDSEITPMASENLESEPN